MTFGRTASAPAIATAHHDQSVSSHSAARRQRPRATQPRAAETPIVASAATTANPRVAWDGGGTPDGAGDAGAGSIPRRLRQTAPPAYAVTCVTGIDPRSSRLRPLVAMTLRYHSYESLGMRFWFV